MLRRLFSSRFKCSGVGGGEKRGTSRNAAKLIFPLPAPTFRLHRLQAKLFYSTSLLSEIPYYIHIALPVGLGRAALSTRHPLSLQLVYLDGEGICLGKKAGRRGVSQVSQTYTRTYVRLFPFSGLQSGRKSPAVRASKKKRCLDDICAVGTRAKARQDRREVAGRQPGPSCHYR